MKNNSLVRFVFAASAFAALSALLLGTEAFEWLYDFTRSHEDWDLDEILLVIFAALVVAPIWFAVELKYSHDETKKHAAEQLALEQELSEARRGQAMGSLAGGMAHSGNNMLQAILTLTRTAQNRLPPTSPVHDILEKIIRSANQTSDIFSSVLKLSRSEQVSGDIIDFGDYLLRNKGVLSSTVAVNIDVEFQDVVTGYSVPLSEAEFTDIMLVLLTNASDSYGGKPGHIMISVDQSPEPRGTINLSVADEGCGIADDVQSRIFDPFYTTKPAGEGTGIGLPVAKRIVERAGGTISFTSMRNKGTTFVITLPMTEER